MIDRQIMQSREINCHSLCSEGIVVSLFEDSDLLGRVIRWPDLGLLPAIVGVSNDKFVDWRYGGPELVVRPTSSGVKRKKQQLCDRRTSSIPQRA